MPISVLPPSRQGLQSFPTKFALQQDRWNDYCFMTLYHLYYQVEGSTPTLIGPVKILRRGQTTQDGILITEPFDQLPADFGSVGSSLDYYQRLNEISVADRDEILAALNDIAANPGLEPLFGQEEGWRISLFRDNPEPEGFLSDARHIYSRNNSEVPDLNIAFTFHPAGWATPIQLYFDAPGPLFYLGPTREIGPSKRKVLLPRRAMVLIGRNGSGKSTLLSRIARVSNKRDGTTPIACRTNPKLRDKIAKTECLTKSSVANQGKSRYLRTTLQCQRAAWPSGTPKRNGPHFIQTRPPVQILYSAYNNIAVPSFILTGAPSPEEFCENNAVQKGWTPSPIQMTDFGANNRSSIGQ